MMTSQSSYKDGTLATSKKKSTVLTDYEGQKLHRRTNTSGQKCRDKELARVTQDVEEIRQTTQMFSHESSSNGASKTITMKDFGQTRTMFHASQSTNRAKPLLHRTRSLPLPERFAKDKTKHKQIFPSLKEAVRDPFVPERRDRQQTAEERDQEKLPDETTTMKTNARSFREHRKLERSKTAPVTLLQPLLKTTPEMVRTKIHIYTSKVHGIEEQPKINSKCLLVSAQRNSHDENPVHLRLHAPVRIATRFPSNDLAPNEEDGFEKFNAEESKDAQTLKKIRKQEKFFQKKERLEESVDVNNNPSKELHHCSFLQFAKERPEPNRI